MKELRDRIKDISDKELQKQIGELLTINSLYQTACKITDFDICLSELLHVICNEFGVGRATIMLYDEKEKALRIKAGIGINDEIIKDVKVKKGEGVSGWVLETGEPLLVEDITKDKRFKKANGQYTTNSFISIPLKTDSDVYGVLNLTNKQTGEVFTEEDLGIFIKIGGYLSKIIRSLMTIEDLRQLNKKKTDYIVSIAHELKVPLDCVGTAIDGLLNILKQGEGEISIDDLKIVQENVERLKRITQNMLSLYVIKPTSQINLVRELIDMKELINHTIGLLNIEAQKKNIRIGVNLSSEPVHVWGSRDGLTEVLVNLLDNAIKYTDNSGDIKVVMEAGDSNVTVSIIDTGRGIQKQDLPYIFDKYYRADSIITGKTEGKGLGLAIVKEIIQLHHGDISVESTPGVGSKFTFTLPRDLRKQERWSDILRGKKILVIDDDAQMREKLRFSLERYSANVIMAVDGVDGINKVKAERPDLIILDLLLPKWDGYKVCRVLKFDRNYKDIPIIIFSVKTGDMDRDLAKETGADLYIDKSVDFGILIEKIRELIK